MNEETQYYRVTWTVAHKDPKGNDIVMSQQMQAESHQDAINKTEFTLEHLYGWQAVEDYEINSVDVVDV